MRVLESPTTIKDLYVNLAELGKIKIGGLGDEIRKSKKPGGRDYRLPESYDHFVITINRRDPGGRLIVDTEVMKKLGERPTTLDIHLLFDNPLRNFIYFYGIYTSGFGYVCKGNAEYAIRRVKDNDGKWTPQWENIKCLGRACPENRKGVCEPHGILNVSLDAAPVIGGVYRYRTTGINSISCILSSQAQILSIGKILAGLPLQLITQAKHVDTQNAGRQLIHYVYITFKGTSEELAQKGLEVAKARAVVADEIRGFVSKFRILPEESLEEQIAYAQEFNPGVEDVVFEKKGEKLPEEEKTEVKEEKKKTEPKVEEKEKEIPETKVDKTLDILFRDGAKAAKEAMDRGEIPSDEQVKPLDIL